MWVRICPYHFQNLNHRGDDADICDQAQECEIHIWQTRQASAPSVRTMGKNEVVDRYGNRLYHDHRNAQPTAVVTCLETARYVHMPQEEREGHIFDKTA